MRLTMGTRNRARTTPSAERPETTSVPAPAVEGDSGGSQDRRLDLIGVHVTGERVATGGADSG